MAGHALIEAYIDALSRQLPPEAVEELADGLNETHLHLLRQGLDPAAAAAAATSEFGTPDQVIAAFTRNAPGRRVALGLLRTAPLFGACWGASLIIGQAWHWPIPTPAMLAYGATLLAIVVVLGTIAASHTDYQRTRLAAIAGIGMIALDATMITVVLLAAPELAWPMAIAIPASLARIALALQAVPRILAS